MVLSICTPVLPSRKELGVPLAWLTADKSQEDLVWEPHINFLVFEAWFMNAQSRLLGTTIIKCVCT